MLFCTAAMDISKDCAPSTFARGHLKQWDLDLEWRRTRCPWQAKASKCPRRPRLVQNGGRLETWQTTSYISQEHTYLKNSTKMLKELCIVYRFFAPLSPMYWYWFQALHGTLPSHCRAAITPSIPYLRSAICAKRCHGAWVGRLTPHPLMMVWATSSTSIRIRIYTETNKHI